MRCILFLICFLAPHLLSAHSGGLDANGGHINLATGIYHCHREDCIPPHPPVDRPTFGPSRYGSSTSKAMMRIHAFHFRTFYCDCPFNPDKSIDFSSCSYAPVDKYQNRKRIEQEHVVPASAFGHYRECWNDPPQCAKKGRKCCRNTDQEFRKAEADLHNLLPAIGQINALRSNTPYGIVSGETNHIGGCDFEIGQGLAEPREEIRGDIARIYFYMADAWNMPLTTDQREMFQQWSQDDPLDDREREINHAVCKEQGNSNPYVERLIYDEVTQACKEREED